MKNIFKKYKEPLILFAVLTFATILLYLPSWIKGGYFTGGGDVRTQTYPFFAMCRSEWISALKNKTLPFYSWYDFLGTNIWASKSDKGMFGIYYFIAFLSPFNFWVTYEIICYLRILITGFSMYAFLKYVFKNNKTALIGSICFALSSYAIYFTSEPYFVTVYSFIPLYFLGIEKYFHENKKILFIITVALVFTSNFYMFYSLSLFTPIYFLYRYFNLNGTFKGWFISALKLIGYYAVGSLISGVVSIPSIISILNNDRVGYFNKELLFGDPKLYLHLLISSFTPTQSYIYGNNVFDDYHHTLKELLVYAGSAVTLIVPQFLLCKEKKYKFSTLALYLVLNAFLFTRIGSSITNGFSEPCFRWTYILIFFNVITFTKLITDGNVNKKATICISIIEVIFIAVSFVFAIKITGSSFSKYIKQVTILAVIVVAIFVTAILIVKEKKKAIIAMTVVELCVFTCLKGVVSSETVQNPTDFKRAITVLSNSPYELEYYLDNLSENNSNEFFRVYVPQESVYWSYSYNMNKVYKLKGLSTYDSAYASSFDDMKAIDYEEIVVNIDWQYDIKDKGIINFLSTKYSITLTEDEIPFDNYEIIDNSYRGFMITALNLDYRVFGTSYTDVISYDEFYSEGNRDTNLLSDYVICDASNLNEIEKYVISNKKSNVYNVNYKNNRLSCFIDCDEKSFVVLSVPYDNGWTIKVNGSEVDKYKVNGGMIGIPVDHGTNSIEMSFVPEGFKLGTLMTATGTIVLIVIIVIEKREKTV